MVLADSHTISKSIDNDNKLDNNIFESIHDVDRPIHLKTRKDRQHKYKLYYSKDEDVVLPDRLKETKPYTGLDKTTAKNQLQILKTTTEHAKHHKSPKRRVGSFWRKLRGKDKKKNSNKHNSFGRNRRISNHKKEPQKYSTNPGPRIKGRRKNRKQFSLRLPEIKVTKRDASGLLSTRLYSNTPQSYQLQMGIASQVDNILNSEYRTKTVPPFAATYARAEEADKNTYLQNELESITSKISDLKTRYGENPREVYTPSNTGSSFFNNAETNKPTTTKETVTTAEPDFPGTAQIEVMLNDMKARARHMVSFQNPLVTDLISSYVTEATVYSYPVLTRFGILAPVSGFNTFVSTNDNEHLKKTTVTSTKSDEFDLNDSIFSTNTEAHYLAARSIKEDTMTIAQNVEDMLQRELKNIYNKVKHKVSSDFRKEIHTAKTTAKESYRKLSSKLVSKCKNANITSSTAPSKSTSPPKSRTSPCKSSKLKKKEQWSLSTTTTTTTTTTAPRVKKKDDNKEEDKFIEYLYTPETVNKQTYDDYMMLTLFEQMLSKTHEDNVRKMLATTEFPFIPKIKRETFRLSKRNPETLTNVKLREVIQNLYDDGGNMPDYDYIDPLANVSSTERTTANNNYNDDYLLDPSGTPDNSADYSMVEINAKNKVTTPSPPEAYHVGHTGHATADADNTAADTDISAAGSDNTALDTSYEGLSGKISYNEFVNGYKHYLNFQKDQNNQNFSNLVKYQAHRHHSVDDIGKYILNKIPPLPSYNKKKREQRFSDDSENNMDYQEITTKNDDSWFRKHFYLFIDNGPPKKYHTSETVKLKSPSTEPKLYIMTEPTPGIVPVPQEQIFIRIGSDGDARKAKQTQECLDYLNLDDLTKVLDSIKNKQTGDTLSKAKQNTQNDAFDPIDNQSIMDDATSRDISMISKLFAGKCRHAPKKDTETTEYFPDDMFAESTWRRLRRSITKENLENTIMADFINKDIEEKASTGSKEILANPVQFNNRETNKYGYVDIDLVPRQTAIVKLRDNAKKSRFKNFFKKFNFKKKKAINPKPKRCCPQNRRRERFNPIKKLKSIFKYKEEKEKEKEEIAPDRLVNPDYDMVNHQLNKYKPVKFARPLSVEDMQKQIPNISDIYFEPEPKKSTTKLSPSYLHLDDKDQDWLYNTHPSSSSFKPSVTTQTNPDTQMKTTTSTKATRATLAPSAPSAPSSSTALVSIPMPSTKKKPEIQRIPPCNVMTVNVKTMNSSTATLMTTESSSLLTIDDMSFVLDNMQNKLKKDPGNFPKVTTVYHPSHVRQTGKYEYKKNVQPSPPPKRPLDELLIKSKLTRIAKFPIRERLYKKRRHDDSELVDQGNDFDFSFERPSALEYIHDLASKNTYPERRKSGKGNTLRKLHHPHVTKANEKDKSRYTDYFNDLLMWHNDILNLDTVTNPLWENILNTIKSDTGNIYTTPNMNSLLIGLKEMNDYLDPGDNVTRSALIISPNRSLNMESKDRVGVRHVRNHLNDQGIIRRVAMDDNTIVTLKDMIIKGEAKYYQYNSPKTYDKKLYSSDFIMKLNRLNVNNDDKKKEKVQFKRKDGRCFTPPPSNNSEPSIIVDTTLMAYDDDVDSVTKALEIKKQSRHSQKSFRATPKNKLGHSTFLKTNKPPVQYYTTPLPMKSLDFNKFLKEHQMDVDFVMSPLLELPTIRTYRPTLKKNKGSKHNTVSTITTPATSATLRPDSLNMKTESPPIKLSVTEINEDITTINKKGFTQQLGSKMDSFNKALCKSVKFTTDQPKVKPKPVPKPATVNSFTNKIPDWEDEFYRFKRYRGLRQPTNAAPVKHNKETQDVNYYSIFKKKMRERLFDKKATKLANDLRVENVRDHPTTESFTVDPHNKDVEITIINFEDMEKITTHQPLSAVTFPALTKEEFDAFSNFGATTTDTTVGDTTPNEPPRKEKEMHNELLYKDIVRERMTSTTAAAETSTLGLTKNTHYVDDVVNDGTAVISSKPITNRYPFEKIPTYPSILKKMQHAKNFNSVPKRVHISSHHYKYDVFYDETKRTGKTSAFESPRSRSRLSTVTRPDGMRPLKLARKRTSTSKHRTPGEVRAVDREVLAGDVISPKLFTAALEEVCKVLDWKGLGTNINDEYITNLRFADDIVVMVETMEDLSSMLDDLSIAPVRVGLKMNMDKTKVMSNAHVTPTLMKIGDATLATVEKGTETENVKKIYRTSQRNRHKRRIWWREAPQKRERIPKSDEGSTDSTWYFKTPMILTTLDITTDEFGMRDEKHLPTAGIFTALVPENRHEKPFKSAVDKTTKVFWSRHIEPISDIEDVVTMLDGADLGVTMSYIDDAVTLSAIRSQFITTATTATAATTKGKPVGMRMYETVAPPRPSTKPATKPATKLATKHATMPTSMPSTKPTSMPTTKPATKSATKPATKHATKPAPTLALTPQPGSLVYDLKQLKSTASPSKPTKDKKKPPSRLEKDRRRRLFNFSALLQNRFKGFMKNLSATTKQMNATTHTNATTQSSKCKPKRTCVTTRSESSDPYDVLNTVTKTIQLALENGNDSEGFRVSCKPDCSSEQICTPPCQDESEDVTPASFKPQKCKSNHHTCNCDVYVEPETYNDQLYYELGPMKCPCRNTTEKPCDPPCVSPCGCGKRESVLHCDIKREAQFNTFTAKDVAALEVIVDLMKNTLSYEDNSPNGVVHSNIVLQHCATKPTKVNGSTNSIQVHIAIPFDFKTGKKRSPVVPGSVRVRKIFSAKMSTPVDLEYQVHSFEGTIAPTSTKPSITSIDDGLSPGMYLLIDKPKDGFALKPVLGQINLSDLKARQAPAGTTVSMTESKPTDNREETTSLKSLAKVTLSKEFVAAVNQQLIEIYENMSRVNKDVNNKNFRPARSVWKSRKLTEKKEGRKRDAEKYIFKRRIDWEAIRKFFGHDRVCNCKCKTNKTMCRACAASDAVIDELIFEFDNIGQYMADHCTEIQTFFWMNPIGGQKLRDSVNKIDKSLSDYYKRVKGKCHGRLCKTFATCSIDKRQFTKIAKTKKEHSMSRLVNDLAVLAEDLNKTISLKVCYSDKLKENGDKFLQLMNHCIITKRLNKRSDSNNPATTPKKLIKNVYSLDNINVNIICNPESSTTRAYEHMLSEMTTSQENSRLDDHLLDFDLEETKQKKRKGLKKLFPRKSKKSKLLSYFEFNKGSKTNYKRQVDNQVATPLISDGGGAFWYDYLKSGTNEPRLARDSIKDTPNLEIAVVQKGATTRANLTEITSNNDLAINTVDMTVETAPERNQRDIETTTDSLSRNIHQMLQLFESLQDVEALNNNTNQTTMLLTTEPVIDKAVSQNKPVSGYKPKKPSLTIVDKVKQKMDKAWSKDKATTYTVPQKVKQKFNSTHDKMFEDFATMKKRVRFVTPKTASTTKNATKDDILIIGANISANVTTLEMTTEMPAVTDKTLATTYSVERNNTSLATTIVPKSYDKSEFTTIFGNKAKTKLGFIKKLKAATLLMFRKEQTSQTPKQTTETPTQTTTLLRTELTSSSSGITDIVSDVNVNEESAQNATENPTILIINDYDNGIGSETLNNLDKEEYRSLLLSIIQFETNNLNDEWDRVAYGGDRHSDETDIKRSIVTAAKVESVKPPIKLTPKTKPPAEVTYEADSDQDKTTKEPESLLNKIVNKIGIKVVNNKKKVVKKPNIREVKNERKKGNFIRNRKMRINSYRQGNPTTTPRHAAEASHTRRPTKPSQICDIQATYDHIQKLQKSLPSKTFETLVRNITCYKYKNVEPIFTISYKNKKGRRWDWIRKKRSLKLHFYNRIKDEQNFDDDAFVMNFGDDSTDSFERFAKGDNGIYKIVKRNKRTANLEALQRGLRNIPTLMPAEDEVSVMVGDSVTLDCGLHTPVRTCDGKFIWKTDRKRMLKQENVYVDGVSVTIHNVEPRNVGTYTCSLDHTVRKNLRLNVLTVPSFDVVFLPVYKTEENCSYDDLKAIQRLGSLMANESHCGKACSIRIDEPVCQRDKGTNSTLIRATAVISMTPHKLNCSLQCKRDIVSSLVMLCATNTASLSSITVMVSKDGVNETLTPWKDFVRPVVTHTLRKKDTNGHHEYHKLVPLLAPGKVDVVVICPAGYYLLPIYKLCSTCPPNTSSKTGDNTCQSCPRGTRSEPGAAKCHVVKPHPRRYDWWWYPPCGYVVACCGVLFGCTACVLLSVMVHVVSRDADQRENEDGDDEEKILSSLPRVAVARAHAAGARPLSPSRVILPRFFRPSLTSSRATDSQETKFELWKERNRPPPLPPIDFDP